MRGWARWLRRVVGLGPRVDGPVPHAERPQFHCAKCREPVEDRWKTCPACGEPTRGAF